MSRDSREGWVGDLAVQAVGSAVSVLAYMDQEVRPAWAIGTFGGICRNALAASGWDESQKLLAHIVGGARPPWGSGPDMRVAAAGHVNAVAQFLAETGHPDIVTAARSALRAVQRGAFGPMADPSNIESPAYALAAGLRAALHMWVREMRILKRPLYQCIAAMAAKLGAGASYQLSGQGLSNPESAAAGQLGPGEVLGCVSISFGPALYLSRRCESPLPFPTIIDRQIVELGSDEMLKATLLNACADKLRLASQRLVVSMLDARDAPARLGDRLTANRRAAFAWLTALGELRPVVLAELIGVSRAGGLSVLHALESCGAAIPVVRRGVQTVVLSRSYGGVGIGMR